MWLLNVAESLELLIGPTLHFSNIIGMAALYNVYLRWFLEYTFIIWNTFYSCEVYNSKATQTRYPKCVTFKDVGIYSCTFAPYSFIGTVFCHIKNSINFLYMNYILLQLHRILHEMMLRTIYTKSFNSMKFYLWSITYCISFQLIYLYDFLAANASKS